MMIMFLSCDLDNHVNNFNYLIDQCVRAVLMLSNIRIVYGVQRQYVI
jgi:hypothetical protein